MFVYSAWKHLISLMAIGFCAVATCQPMSTTRYLGCYLDSSTSRILPSAGVQTYQTPQSCYEQAVVASASYFGVEYGGQCFYGVTFDPTSPKSTCNIACTADPTQNCGGFNAIQIYATAGKVTVPQSAVLLGCYADSPTARILPSEGANTYQTPQSCFEQAVAARAGFFGVEHGGECYYSTSFNTGSPNSTVCDSACTADPTQNCGGFNAIQVYAAPGNVTKPSSSSYLGCYLDNPNSRILSAAGVQTYQTPQSCYQQAVVASASYFGVEYGGQCFYGANFDPTSPKSTVCDTACSADPTQNCGGFNTIQVYATSG